uniref:Delta-5 desaturase n=1 Tax=Thraustochytrium aureum TaxID=42467 RepID=F1T2K7_9STRA|nr:delta-5 desaturase [Thraustochytrium aureum]
MGRGGEGQVNSVQVAQGGAGTRKTILIEGEVYDVTNFRHPGGSIIKFLTTDGTEAVDATNAFREFHCRSGKAEKYLKSLPKLGAPSKMKFDAKEQARRDAITRDYVKLREEMVAEGLFKPAPLHIVYRFAEIAALFAASFYLFSMRGNVFATLAAIAVGGIAQGRCGWLMHECGHFSMTGYIPLDVRLQELVYGVGCSMSASWWRVQHSKHHATPQKLKHDVDLDTLPLVAFNEKIAAKVRPGSFQAKWLSAQAYIFAPVSCFLVGLFWTLFLHPRHMLRTSHFAEMAAVAVRVVGWAALMHSFGYSGSDSFGLYMATFGFGCTYIFTNFAVSHTHLDVTEPDEFLHWVEYAALHTTNVSNDSWFITWWMSYLNFQIEHHLFPSLPQLNAPRVAPRVRALFEKHGMAYDERPYPTALGDTFANLHAVGQNAGQAAAKAA